MTAKSKYFQCIWMVMSCACSNADESPRFCSHRSSLVQTCDSPCELHGFTSSFEKSH